MTKALTVQDVEKLLDQLSESLDSSYNYLCDRQNAVQKSQRDAEELASRLRYSQVGIRDVTCWLNDLLGAVCDMKVILSEYTNSSVSDLVDMPEVPVHILEQLPLGDEDV